MSRYKGKVEHFRMTKGAIGENIRTQLLKDKVLSLELSMYFLDANALGDITGASFKDIKMKNITKQTTMDYINKCI